MKKFNFLNTVTLAFCETLEEKVARYRQAGLSEEEIDKLLLDLPSGFKAGQKLFTQDDVTKFRNDERRKVEATLRGKQPEPIVNVPPVVIDPNTGQTTPVQTAQPIAQPQGLTVEEINNLVSQSIQTALEQQKTVYEGQINTLKTSLDNVTTSYNADKQKAFDTRKAQILAELPQTVHNLLVGDTIEALEQSYVSIKSFIDTTKQELQAGVTAQQAQEVHQATVFYKADDGTEYLTVNDLTKNINHLNEWKSKQR